MLSLKNKFALKSVLAAAALLLGNGAAWAQTAALTAAPANAALADGSVVPMWGYTCGAVTSGATCLPLNPNAGTGWSPVVITVPYTVDATTGASTTSLTISLTNNLSFTPTAGAAPTTIPTSLTIVGQLGGGLGSGGTSTPSPNHANAQPLTWPIAGDAPGAPVTGVGTPPAQNPRVQSFGTEVLVAGATAGTNQCTSPCNLTWNNLKVGTYLIESGTHPSIQGPMGLYGILIVTTAPNGATAGTAYGTAGSATAVSYNSEVPLILSEIDPVQNTAVSAAVATAGFAETNVWAGLSAPTTTTPSAVLCRTVSGGAAPNGACYPPAVNYTPLYYLINGVAFDRTHSTNSLFASTVGTALAPVSGTVLVRLVNAGLRMHVPSIVGSQTAGVDGNGATATVAGFTLVAEDGNQLPPAKPRVQSEVFMPAGKTIDATINVPGAGGTALPIYDRQLSLSGNASTRDAGMLAYVGVNGAGLPGTGAFTAPTVQANPDAYFVVTGQTLVVSDPAKGVLANDVGISGAQLSGTVPAGLTFNTNGTFSYSGAPTSFTYCGNGLTTANACTTVSLNACTGACLESASGLTVTALTYNANGTFLRIQPPGILAGITDAAGHPLKVTGTSAGPLTVALSGGGTATVDANGGFFASVASCMPASPATTCAATFNYTATNSQGVASPSNTVTINFLPASNLNVTVLDGKDVLAARQNAATCTPGTPGTNVNGCVTPAVISDYRWVIEEDRTFYVNPNCTTNPPAAGCPGTSTAGLGVTGIVPTFGTNFHSSHMPVIATGCTGSVSCEGGQTVYDPVSGGHINAVCDQGNGVCRADSTGSGFTATFPAQVHLDPTRRYYISVLPGDAATPFESTNLSADCTNGVAAATSPGTCGHGMGGAPLACQLSGTEVVCSATDAFAPVTILTEPAPYPPAKLSVFVFEDDFPLNGEQDGGGGVDVLSPNEPGLGGFNITLFDDAGGSGDATGQMTYDMFNQPLSNSLAGTIDPATGLDACPVSKISRIGANDPTQTGITGTIVTCPKYESDSKTLSPLAGQAVVANLMPGRYGVVATPGADAIARGEEWLQTNTLDGQKAHDSFLRIGEPSFFQEFGPAGFHVSIGFANPAIINARRQYICDGTDPNSPQPGTPYTCNNTVTGQVTTERMSRTPDERLYSSGDYTSFAFTQCYVSLGDPDGEDFAFTKCNADGTFTLSKLPEGLWRITVFDQWNDMLVDGLSTPVPLGGGATVALGQIAMNQWQSNIYTRTFFDFLGTGNGNDYTGTACTGVGSTGTPTPAGCNPNYGNPQAGLTLVATNNRFRDGSFSNFNNTDLSGNAGFNEIFPLFSWYVIETDSTRYKNTGTHVVYDAGGPADGTPCGNSSSPSTAPCGSSNIGSGLANTAEIVPVPANLRVPGAVYCALGDGSGADCASSSIAHGPFTPGGSSGPAPGACTISPTTGQTSCSGTQMSTGRIDPPWVTSEAWQGFSGQNQIIEFGKKPYAPGENGGIHGHVIYASTRPFDDPQLLLQTSWEPLVPNVRINLYQVGTAADGTQSLTLVDWTTTSSWDDWAQGFRSDGIPNMNCPGQLAQPTSGAAGDLFYFTLYNQPMWLDLYNSQHGGAAPTALPNNAQFKCYDGMHNWNQVQPAPYDGMYQFPSVTARNPVTGNTIGTHCTACVKDNDPNDPFRYQKEDMLPAGQYVVEVVVPPGFELVKEEDKNILIGDNYIAPATVQFPGLGGSIYILPDQASMAAQYNANQAGLAAFNGTNMQNPTQALGRISSLPSHEGDTGSVESFWPCVGTARIVPDYISLFPGSAEVAPFAGAVRNLCDRKLVQLDDQTQALAKFYVFTSTHTAAHFSGVITDDFTSEFDPFSPQFGEKFSPANLPVAIKDWTGQEVSRVYADQWGTYNGLTYSTWEVNPPNPTGYAPTMMVTCMNDAGSGPTPDPLYNPAYSQFCYEIPFMPAQTQYMDTPVVPTSAFAGAGYNNADCDYPDATPAVSEVDVDSNIGPWADGTGSSHTLHIYALGTVAVNNYAYSGPAANTAPFNAKTVTRKYSFGASGTLALVSPPNSAGNTTTTTLSGAGVTWGDLAITATMPALSNAFNCPLQQQVQYGGPGSGSPAKCAQLVITAANGRQSVDAITITIGGKAPTHISPTANIQTAIDAAKPGDMLIVDPATRATSAAPAGAAVHEELLLMWKPIRLQGVGAAASVINANTHPAGKLDVWRRQVNCLFGLSLSGYQSLPGGTPFAPYDPSGAYTCGASANFGAGPTTLFGFQPTKTNPQVDRLPLEAVIGWNAGLNGNLAELLQEPSLMGALEGAAITVLSKGVFIPNGSTDVFGATSATAGSYPTGTLLVTGGGNQTRGCGNDQPGTNGFHPNPFPSNFQCNPSSIDGLTIENSSQGGGGVFVHGWGHNIQIANNRVTNNSGTLSGGVNVGQGEFPGAYTIGGINTDPGSCQTSGYSPNASLTGKQLPYCFDLNVNMHHNMITKNSSTGDELFSATPAGAGGVSICNGSDYYRFNYNWVCGNLSTGDGGGVGHLGYSYNGDIEHNSILFNQSTNPTIATNGGGLLIMGAPDVDPTCGLVTDVDCLPTPVSAPSDGVGPGLIVNANLIQGNGAESGSGGGLRLQHINGTDVTTFPTLPSQWYAVSVTNNIIVNNVAGWDGAGISLLDALDVNIVNNTIVSNDTTASSGMLFNTLGAPLASTQGPCPVARNPDGTCPQALTTSTPQPAGVVTMANSSQLATAMSGLPAGGGGVRWVCPAGHFSGGSANNANCGQFSFPLLYNDLIWQNRSFSIHISGLGTGPLNQQNVVALQPTLSQTSTGFCVSEPAFSSTSGGYWEIGVRGDSAPNAAGSSGNASGGSGAFVNPRLMPRFSILTDAADYPSLNDSGANPAVLSQYCNGARVPPENGGLGYDVPPGIADATVPNPIFSLTPAATVDEGNNWINIAWGPLSVSNQSVSHSPGAGDTLLGNYAIGAGSPAVNAGSAGQSGVAAPTTDFFGTTRPQGGAWDVGAVEVGGGGGGSACSPTVAPTTLAFGNEPVTSGGTTLDDPMTVTVTNNGTGNCTGGSSSFGGGSPQPFARAGAAQGGGGSCAGTLGAGAACTINVVFSPKSASGFVRNLTITYSNGTVTGSPVSLTGTGVAVGTGTLTFTSATNGTLSTVLGVRTLTFTIPTPRAAVTSVVTVTNSGTGPLLVTNEALSVNIGGLYSITGTTCSNATPLAAGGTCTVSVRYATPTVRPGLPDVGAMAVTNNGTGTAGGASTLALVAQ